MYINHLRSRELKNKFKREKNTDKLITMPNQALTPQQILNLFVQNRTGELPQRKFAYNPELSEQIPDMEKMDKIQLEQFRETHLKRIADTQKRIKEQQQQLKDEKAFLQRINQKPKDEPKQDVNNQE